jgi:hypothetical protein
MQYKTPSQEYLNLLYPKTFPQQNLKQKNISETYGEILYESISKLINHLSISEQDVFFDLGSGLGKVAIQFFLNSAVKESHGIEIIPELHYQALNAAKKTKQDLPDFFNHDRKLNFLSGNFLDCSFNKASVVLLGSPCFSQKILNQLGEKFNMASTIHTVLSLRPINTLKRLSFKKAIRVECSWDSALCYIYQL